MYAVIDLETTGLRTSWHDRVVEIAIVHVGPLGAIEDEWCTLVNPERDLGPQHIHGISAAEARVAPRFAQLAGAVAGRMRRRVPVAHNWAFDGQFLGAEFARAGITAPVQYEAGLCTMRLAGQFFPGSSRGLADCCAAAGIALTQAHSALHDARAAAGLLAHFLRVTGQPPPWAHRFGGDDAWPALADSGVAAVGRRAEGTVEEHFLGRLVDRMPRSHRPDADAYLEVLDRALLDRHVSAAEADALVDVAQRLRLGRADVVELHRQYLQALAAFAAADGVVTDAEQEDLETVARLLGLGGQAAQMVRMARHAASLLGGAAPVVVPRPREGGEQRQRFRLEAGDIVVFTGDMGEPREVWAARAGAAGLRVGTGVTRRTRLLVAADPDTMSGKGKKAAEYGIPVVHPAAFLGMLPGASGR